MDAMWRVLATGFINRQLDDDPIDQAASEIGGETHIVVIAMHGAFPVDAQGNIPDHRERVIPGVALQRVFRLDELHILNGRFAPSQRKRLRNIRLQ